MASYHGYYSRYSRDELGDLYSPSKHSPKHPSDVIVQRHRDVLKQGRSRPLSFCFCTRTAAQNLIRILTGASTIDLLDPEDPC